MTIKLDIYFLKYHWIQKKELKKLLSTIFFIKFQFLSFFNDWKKVF